MASRSVGAHGFKRRLPWLLIGVLVGSVGCGYALVGRGSFLPESVKRVSFPTFKNSTPRVGLEQRLSKAVASELASRGRFSVSARRETETRSSQARSRPSRFIPSPPTLSGGRRNTRFRSS